MSEKLTLPFPTADKEIQDGIEKEALTDTAASFAEAMTEIPTTKTATNITIPKPLNVLMKAPPEVVVECI
jgi:hypothetical protein